MSTQTMDRKTDRIENRGRPDHLPGFTVAELVVTGATVAIIIGILYAVFADTLGGVNRTQAVMQINGVISEAKRYRSTFAQGGLYTGLTLSELGGANDSVAGIDTVAGLNVYGLPVSIGGTGTPAVDATLTYRTPSDEDCAEILDSFSDGTNFQSGLKSPTECGSGASSMVLTITLE